MEHIADLAGRVAVLEAMVSAQQRCILSLGVMVPIAARKELLRLLKAQQLNADANGETHQAAFLGVVIEQLHGLAGPLLDERVSVAIQTLALQALLQVSAPAGHEEAMRSWLAIATEAEIGEELLEVLRALKSVDDRPGKPAAEPARAKKRGGAASA